MRAVEMAVSNAAGTALDFFCLQARALHFHCFCDLVCRILLHAGTSPSRGITAAESLASGVEIDEVAKNQFAPKLHSCEKVLK